MSDRQAIGLDNPALSGRLRQAIGLARPFISEQDDRPSAKYYSQFVSDSYKQAQSLRGDTSKETAPVQSRFKPLSKSEEPIKQPSFIKTQPKSHQLSKSNVNDVALPKTWEVIHILQEHTPKPKLEPDGAYQSEIPQIEATEEQPSRRWFSSISISRIIRPIIHPVQFIKSRGYSKLQWSLISMAVSIFIAGAVVSAITYNDNRINNLRVDAFATSAAAANEAATNDQSGSGGSAPLSTVKPTAAEIENYAVGPTLPKYLIIPKLGVDARVLSVGLLNNGALGTPNNVYNVAWYNESSLPGQPGAELIDGHVSSWTAHGVFYGIKTLVAGDPIEVVTGNNTTYTYTVVSHQIFGSNNVNMQTSITPIVPGQPGLNLITCTGDVIPGTSLFNERILVYATLNPS